LSPSSYRKGSIASRNSFVREFSSAKEQAKAEHR